MNTPQPTSKREAKLKPTNNRFGLAFVLLILISLVTQNSVLISTVAQSIAFVLLISSFVNGYRKGDEYQKLIALQAVGISFLAVMLFLLAATVTTTLVPSVKVAPGTVFFVGLIAHLFALPMVSKNTK